MRYRPMTVMILLAAAWLWPVSPPALAGQKASAAIESDKYKAQDERNRRFFTDLKVMTHEGKELRFYSDILKNKLVVISFFYTNCPTAQPPLVTFFKLQKKLGDRLGREILLLTLSVDPEKDTPAVVWEYAKKYNPQKGWLFLTGNEKNMEIINRRLGNTLRLPEGHQRLFLLGNLRTGNWMRMLESAPVIALTEGLRNLASEE